MTTEIVLPSRRRRLIPLLAILILLGGWLAWKFLVDKSVDMVAVMRKNSEGVGVMEQFQYERATAIFKEVSRMAPDWIPGQINLAVATLNNNTPETIDEAAKICRRVLEKDAANPHAHYIIGILHYFREQYAAAYPHFEAVTKVDPLDAYSWYYLGDCHPAGRDSVEAFKLYEKALKCDPYLNMARYRIAFHPQMEDVQKRKEFLDDFERLRNSYWEVQSVIRYYDMGPYARVIGLDARNQSDQKIGPVPAFEKFDNLQVVLAEGASWRNPARLGTTPHEVSCDAVLERFGGTMILLDYDRDDKIDILLLRAVDDKSGGRVRQRNLLLHNEGGGKFVDRTREAGLADDDYSLSAAVGDFDNDGFPDLFLGGLNKQKLYRNLGNGKFEDVSAKAGLDKVQGCCLGAGWVDVDQDADLDLVLCLYSGAEKPEGEVKDFKPTGGSVAVFINTGLAPPVVGSEPAKALTVEFSRMQNKPELLLAGPVANLTLTDFDGDKDVDLLLFADDGPRALRNNRLLRFETVKNFPLEKVRWNGATVLDANRDEKSDLFVIATDRKPKLLLSKEGYLDEDPAKWFSEGATNSPPLKQARSVDLDLDGWTDIIGIATDGKPVYLQNDGHGKLVHQLDTFGPDLPGDLVSIALMDVDGDCTPDAVMWSLSKGLVVRRNLGNGNKALRISPSGNRTDAGNASTRTNADGIGSWVVVQSGGVWTGGEYTTLSSGLGQSLVPFEFGIGKQNQADVVRIRWPDLVPQAELDVATCQKNRIAETNRKPTSCPTLFVWDGERYRFLSDLLGAGSMGELGADGSTRPPRPEESFKIEPGILMPLNGKFAIKISEPMDETMYLDRLELLAIDLPKNRFVYPDERFPASENPSQELLVLRERIFPKRVVDHRGKDKTETLREFDGKTVDDFAHRRWMGFAEDHYIELDFADALSKIGKGERLYLCLAGWTEYAFPESIFAAGQARVEMQVPVMEMQQPDGSWKAVCEISLPAGLPRVMTREVTGLLGGAKSKFRIRSNLQVYWDQIYLAPLERIESKPHRMPVAKAELTNRGFIQEVRTSPRGPISYDDSRTESVAFTKWKGRFTRLGDITELLTETDDRFAICGPGDEVRIEFDATKLPPVPDGYERSFVLKSWGYCKDTTPFTYRGGEIEPLPYRAMGNYPPRTANPDQKQAEYDRQWNTRIGGGGR